MSEYPLLNAVLFAVLALLIFFAALAAGAKLAPGDLWKEVFENQNAAAGIVLAGMAVALAILVAAAFH